MANSITAGNSSNGGTAIVTDTSGTLEIKTGTGSGTTAISIDASQNVTISGTLNAGAITNTTGSFSGNLSFNSGYGSAAVAYGCRAWVNFNGTGTVAIRGSGNVTSITDNGVGDYTVNFTTAMPDGNYSAVASSYGGANAGLDSFASVGYALYGTSGFDMHTSQPGGTTANRYDPLYVSVAVFR